MSDLLERGAELDRIDAVLAQSRARQGRLLLVDGVAGVGKSSLLSVARARASDAGMTVLTARGAELEREFAFGLVRQLLEAPLAALGAEGRAEALAGPAAPAEAVFTGNADGPDESTRRLPMLHGLYWTLSNLLAAGDPAAVLIDDAHWADLPSLEFLAFLLPRVEELPIAVLVAARPGQGAAQILHRRVAGDQRGAETLRVSPLSAAATGALIGRRLGSEPEPAFATACFELTGGNAFLVTALARELATAAISPVAGELGRLRGLVPESITRAVMARTAAVSPTAPALARAVAILGDGAELRTAARLAGSDIAAATADAAGLARSGVLADALPLAFAHAIVGTAVAADLTAAERAAAHARAARLLHEDGASTERIAAHLLMAEPAGDRRAVATLREAAAQTRHRGDPAAAARMLARALREPPASEAERCGVLLELGEAELEAASDFESACSHIREAMELSEAPGTRARAARQLAVAHLACGRYGDAVDVLQATAGAMPEGERELRLRLEAELGGVAQLHLDTAPLTAERLSRYASVPGKTPGERLVLANLARQAWMSGRDPGRAADLAQRALGDGSLLGDHGPQGTPVYYAIWTLIVADHLDTAEAELDRAIAEARRRGIAFAFSFSSALRSSVALRRGDLAGAEADARAAVDASREHGAADVPHSVASLIEALVERGHAGEAARELELAGLTGELPEDLFFQSLLHARGRLRLALDAAELGVADLLELGRRHRQWGVHNPTSHPWRVAVAPALVRLGDVVQARELAREQDGLGRSWSTPRAVALGRLAQALVSFDDAESARLFRDAADAVRGEPAPLERARALLGLGAALRRRGERRTARVPLREAVELARRHDAVPLLEEAVTELRAAGAHPGRLDRSADPLTVSERRVAEMAAAGNTNPQIAAALFVTRRTVETHLTHVYQKLDIASREELAAALAKAAGGQGKASAR